MPADIISEKVIEDYKKRLDIVREEIHKIIVGQHEAIDNFIIGLIANGHILVEGVPGIAKTVTIRTLAAVTGCNFKRVQFTVDLLPTDITGIMAYDPAKGFYVVKGPIFANFILADEINRAPPKTQSALLEAMGEKQVTIGRQTFPMKKPFFVLATQNPIETSGTYTLPEAQIDRFLFKLFMTYPNEEEETEVMKKNISVKRFSEYDLRVAFNPELLVKAQEDVKKVFLSKEIEKYITKLTMATRYPEKYKIEEGGKYIRYGGSPRATIGMYLASKAAALVDGKNFVTPDHVKKIAINVLRHRIILNYEGLAEGISTDDIVNEIVKKVPTP